MMEVKVTKTTNPKVKPDPATVPFGVAFTDHMFMMDYDSENGWQNPRIVPFGDISLNPGALVFHYGAEVFEGLKAYRTPNGEVQMFRPAENFKRMNNSAERLCLPQFDVDDAVEYLRKFVEVEKDWVPDQYGTSLYLRPFLFGTDADLALHGISHATFMVIACVVGSYYKSGLAPVDMLIEMDDVRAVRGGTGYAKCGGNYAAATRAGEKAAKKGYSQVVWVDGVERKYVEEGGSLCMIGGYMSFTGIDGTARYGQTEIADVLPVEMLDIDDRVEAPQGLVPELIEEHEAVSGLEGEWPYLLGYNKTITKSDAKTLVKIGEDPLIAIGEYGKGKSAVFTSDCSPHWGSPAFVEWEKYDLLWKDLLDWMTK